MARNDALLEEIAAENAVRKAKKRRDKIRQARYTRELHDAWQAGYTAANEDQHTSMPQDNPYG